MSSNSTSPKDAAIDFLALAARGDSRIAFEKYAAKEFKHHNAYFKGDAESLILAMEVAAKEKPNKFLNIQRTIHEGDLVAVHSHIKQDEYDNGAAVIHIFRFDKGKIVELWDFGQAVPDEMLNENGMF